MASRNGCVIIPIFKGQTAGLDVQTASNDTFAYELRATAILGLKA